MIRVCILSFLFLFPALANATLMVGVGVEAITPPPGTPSAGYAERKGEGMEGVHDPLLAIALFIDNGEKQVVFCSVDHLGYTYEMAQEVVRRVHQVPELAACEIYIASSHTHSGGGAFLKIPLIGEALAGPYDPSITDFYIEQTKEAILKAGLNPVPAKIGIGYGESRDLSKYRGKWPVDIEPLTDVAMIKLVKLDGSPLAVLFNYAVHPTVLDSSNEQFSADFVGYARKRLQILLGLEVQPLYFNGAQGDIVPAIFDESDRFLSCGILGSSLAESVYEIWKETETSDCMEIQTENCSYSFTPQATPFGLRIPLESYETEMNVIVLDQSHAFLTIPGELSTLYDRRFKEFGKTLGYSHVSVFGLTNDAHGYIILPESWRHQTYESQLSFGGEFYGEEIRKKAETLLKKMSPLK